MTSTPTLSKNRGISAIWTLPVIALIICGWLIWSSYQNSGIEITITFNDASGIIPDKTQVMARGIPVGLVKEVIPDLENKSIKAIVKIEQVAAPYLMEDTLFWVVRPELSASSVQGLDTILSGSYIGVQVGSSTVSQTQFNGLNSAPPISSDTPGLHLQLRAEVLGSIQVGTGIYYRNIQIGTVQKHQLERDESIMIDFFIEPKFSHLVREGSRFCNASGVQISGKLPNLKVHIESLASLLRGGVLLHTPEQLLDTPQVNNGHIFSLYPDYESANYGIAMTLTLSSGQDIVEGSTKVMYRGLEAGFVKEIQINNDERRTVTAHIMLDPRAELILRKSTKFWLVKPEISPAGIKNLRLLLAGPHITFQPGDGEFQDHFEILTDPPPQEPLRQGATFFLSSTKPVNISSKSPVYFKNIQVGEVVDTDLDKTGSTILTSLFIYQKYVPLVNSKSLFWIHSGIEVGASIDKGIEITTGPLAHLLYGGISFTTPEIYQQKDIDTVEDGRTFRLFDSYDGAIAATPALHPSTKKFQVISPDARSLSVGSPLLHKNIKIGEILDFHLTKDQKQVLINCFVYNKYENLVHENSRFYNTSGIRLSGGLGGINLQTGSLQSIVAGGIGCLNLKPGKKTTSTKVYSLFDNLEEALHADEIELTFYLDNPGGIKVGSPLRHKSIEIGKINNITFSEDLKTIICTARVKEKMAPLFTSNTLVWVAQAEVNLSGVKNVETLVFGSYLHFLSNKGVPSRSFKVLTEPPRTRIANQNGLGVILETTHLGSLSPGSPVYYRQIQVGEVTGFELSATFQKVYVYVSIKNRFKPVIRENTKFWNVSGAKVEGGIFSGLSITTESFETIMRGGLALATPNNAKSAPAATSGFHFTLHDKAQKDWLDWNPNIILLEEEQPVDYFSNR